MQDNDNIATNDQGQEARAEKSTTFPCPSCGGKMTFDPATQTLKCAHCGASVPVAALDNGGAATHDYLSAPRQSSAQNWQAGKRAIKCESCGASTVIDDNTAATFCPFCGAPHVMEDTSAQGISPETLLPFTVSESSAKEMFKTWVGKRRMAPAALKNNAAMGKLSGVYLPFWAFDADTDSHYTGREGHHYYETEVYYEEEDGKRVRKTRQVQKTRWFNTSGFVSEYFDDVTVPAAEHANTKLLNAIEPFPIDKLTAYQQQYVSGFLAEKASVSIDDGWSGAKDIIDDKIEDLCRDDILSHADEAEVTHVNTRYENIAYKQFLLPVWLSSYKFKDKTYQFMINGQTGKVKGEAPVSKAKVAIIVAAAIALIIGIICLVGALNKDEEYDGYEYQDSGYSQSYEFGDDALDFD